MSHNILWSYLESLQRSCMSRFELATDELLELPTVGSHSWWSSSRRSWDSHCCTWFGGTSSTGLALGAPANEQPTMQSSSFRRPTSPWKQGLRRCFLSPIAYWAIILQFNCMTLSWWPCHEIVLFLLNLMRHFHSRDSAQLVVYHSIVALEINSIEPCMTPPWWFR